MGRVALWIDDAAASFLLGSYTKPEQGDLIRSGAAFVEYDDATPLKVTFELDRVAPIVLANVRAFVRKYPPNSIDFMDQNRFIRRIDLPPKAIPDDYLTGLLEGLVGIQSRFFQWGYSVRDVRAPKVLRKLADDFCSGQIDGPAAAINVARKPSPQLRYISYEICGGSIDFHVHETSKNLRDGGTEWFKTAKGKSFLEFPDSAYCHWTLKNYLEVMSTNTPTIDRVSVDIIYPNGARSQQDYFRLLLPFRRAPRSSLVALMSDLDFTADISFL